MCLDGSLAGDTPALSTDGSIGWNSPESAASESRLGEVDGILDVTSGKTTYLGKALVRYIHTFAEVERWSERKMVFRVALAALAMDGNVMCCKAPF